MSDNNNITITNNKRSNDEDIKNDEPIKKNKIEENNNEELHKLLLENKKEFVDIYKKFNATFIQLQQLNKQIIPNSQKIIQHLPFITSNLNTNINLNTNANPNNIDYVVFLINDKQHRVHKEVINKFPESTIFKIVNQTKTNKYIMISRNANNFEMLIRWMCGNLETSLLPLHDIEFNLDIRYYGMVKYIFGKERIFAIGGQKGDETLDSIDCYYPNINKWIKMATMPQGLRRSGCVIHNHILYIIGGHNGFHQQRNMVCYDIKNNKWYNGVPMGTIRTALSVVSAHGLIFAIGGYHINEVVGIVEIFHIGIQKWLPYQHSLKCARLGHSTSYDSKSDKIYVIGGWDSTTHFSSCEVLDLKKPEEGFNLISPMNTPRSELTSVCLNGKIYAIGGYDGINFLSSVEVYDPKTNEWSIIAPMMFERGWPSATVSEGKIYVSGGRFKPGSMLNTTEVYDPDTNIWSVCSNMNIHRDGHQLSSYTVE